MQTDKTILAATAIVFVTGTLWGLYWIPVRQLEALGLPGAWGTAAITAAAALILLPVALRNRRAIAAADPVALVSLALGGAAFALYSIGLVYGRVAIIILLYFLTPVWSALIGRYVMGWQTPRLRIAAIGVGLLGLAVMLGAHGQAPVPRGAGEWMALIAGLLWSVATTGIRTRSQVAPAGSALVFATGATIAALLLALHLPPADGAGMQARPAAALGLAAATGGFWWGLTIAALMWATVRLEPARVGILLMSEVLVGAISAAVLAGETLHRWEIAGGALVLCAGLLEVWPVRRIPPDTPV